MLLVDKKERETRRPPSCTAFSFYVRAGSPFFSPTFLHFYYYDTHVVSSKKKRGTFCFLFIIITVDAQTLLFQTWIQATSPHSIWALMLRFRRPIWIGFGSSNQLPKMRLFYIVLEGGGGRLSFTNVHHKEVNALCSSSNAGSPKVPNVITLNVRRGSILGASAATAALLHT